MMQRNAGNAGAIKQWQILWTLYKCVYSQLLAELVLVGPSTALYSQIGAELPWYLAILSHQQ